MSKSIKISEENYHKVQAQLRPRETYNDVITRLLLANEKAWELLNVIEGSLSFRVRQQERLMEVGKVEI